MEAVIDVFFIAVRLSFFHLIAASILAWILLRYFKKYDTKKYGFIILFVSTSVTYFALCYNLATQICVGRTDFSHCTNEVLIMCMKAGVVLIPLIFFCGALGLVLELFYLRRDGGKQTKK